MPEGLSKRVSEYDKGDCITIMNVFPRRPWLVLSFETNI